MEHPYGTIKQQWGFGYIKTRKTIKRVFADVGFVFTAYYLRRILNIIGIEAFMSYLLAFFAVSGSIFASIEPSWRGLKNRLPFCPQNFAHRRMVLMPILAGRFCNETELKRGY